MHYLLVRCSQFGGLVVQWPVVCPCVSGLSLDHQTVSAMSRVRLSEREEESLSCYLRACDASLYFLQELDKVAFSYILDLAWSIFVYVYVTLTKEIYLCLRGCRAAFCQRRLSVFNFNIFFVSFCF